MKISPAVWDEISDEQLALSAKKVVETIGAEVKNQKNEELRKVLKGYAKVSGNNTSMKRMVENAQSELNMSISINDIDTEPYLLGTENTIIDLKTGKAVEEGQFINSYVTKHAGVKYDPGAECPVFMKFISDCTKGDKDQEDYLQRVAGYSLTGDTKEQCFFILYGEGKNGKSTLLNILSTICGDYSNTLPADSLSLHDKTDNPALAKIKGARIVVAHEMKENAKIDINLLKLLTGGDEITARFLHRNYFSFYTECKIFMTANKLPKIDNLDPAIKRRIRTIPFRNKIPADKMDKDLLEKLKKEKSGILNWTLEGCLKWQEEGLNEPDIINEASNSYFNNLEPVMKWISSYFSKGRGKKVYLKELLDKYNEWAEKNDEISLSNKEIKQQLENNGFEFKRGGKGMCTNGLIPKKKKSV